MTMKASYPIILAFGLVLPLSAQNLEAPKEERIVSDEVQKAIDEFNRMKNEGKEKANEVTVVIPPQAPEEPVEEKAALPAGDEEKEEPVLVTGKPPGDTTAIPEEPAGPKPPEPIPPPELSEPEPSAPSEPGLEVRVESIRKGTGKLDPEKINLRASFPAKPLASPPSGWLMEKSPDAPEIQREVELQPGTVISLDIKPHVLIPDADGANVFAVNEPGFDPVDGYRQKQTVSAILSKSVIQLDEDAKQLGNALTELNRILSSLPQPEPKAMPVEEVEQ